MRAITASCLLLLASIAGSNVIHNFGIMGGTKINITEVPFMALYRKNDQYYGCGASIVNEMFIVSAAHCAYFMGSNNSRITVGTDVYNGGLDYEIDNIHVHPKFSMSTIDYDISVIKLKKKLTFSDRVQPIKMVDLSVMPKPGEMMQVIGFGDTENYVDPKHLLSVNLPFVDRKQCKQDYQNFEVHVTDRMICAGGHKEQIGTCWGDSGGPLFYKRQLFGVVSWGRPACGRKGYPSVFSDVHSMMEFIEEVIKSNA